MFHGVASIAFVYTKTKQLVREIPETLLALPLSEAFFHYIKYLLRKEFNKMALKKNNKSVQILIRVTPSEYQAIRMKAAKSGMTVSAFIRHCTQEETIMEAPPIEFNKLIAEMKRVGTNLNQLILQLRIQNMYEDPKVCQPEAFTQVRDELFNAIKLVYSAFIPTKPKN